MRDIGQRLKAKREELGLSLQQVQADTKIRRRYLEALEAGDESPIPGEVYVKGFLRFYANYLGLDGLELVREYREKKERRAAEAALVRARPVGRRALGRDRTPVLEAKTDPSTRTAMAPGGRPAGLAAPSAPAGQDDRELPGLASCGSVLKTAAGPRSRQAGSKGWRVLGYALLMVVIVAVGGLYYAWSQGPAPGPEGGGGEPTADGADGEPPAGGTGEPGDQAQPGGSGPGAPNESSEPHWSVTGESDRQVGYVVYGSPFTVSLDVVTGKCWVKVTADGQAVFEQTLGPGSRGEWTATGRMTIILGRPQLARVSIDQRVVGSAGTADSPRTLIFEAGNPPAPAPSGGGTGGSPSPGEGSDSGGA